MASLVVRQEKKIITDAWAAQTWKVALLSSSFTYNYNTHTTYATLTNEIVGTGYTAGGATLTGKASSYVNATTVMLDANDTSWGPGATLTNVKYAACYDTSTGALRALYELTTAQSCTNATFTLQWNSAGLIRIA